MEDPQKFSLVKLPHAAYAHRHTHRKIRLSHHARKFLRQKRQQLPRRALLAREPEASPASSDSALPWSGTHESDLASRPGPEAATEPVTPPTSLVPPAPILKKYRAPKVAKACDHCRATKLKCGIRRPCKNCTTKGLDCKPEYGLEAMLDFIEASIDGIAAKLDDRLDRLEIVISRINPSTESNISVRDFVLRDDTMREVGLSPLNDNFASLGVEDDPDISSEYMPPPDFPVALYVLLLWPPIDALAGSIVRENGIDDPRVFPLMVEMRRHVNNPGSSECSCAACRLGGIQAGLQTGLYLPSIPPPWLAYPATSSMILLPQLMCDMSEARVWELIDSFEANILSLQPLVTPAVLRSAVQIMLQDPATPRVRETYTRNPYPVMDAIVYLCLALGEACAWNDGDNNPLRPASWHRNIPTLPSSSADPLEMPTPTPSNTPVLMPGVKYYNAARAILRADTTVVSLSHIVAHLLAGLYHAQFARLRESLSYTAHASWMLLTMITPMMDHFQAMLDNNTTPQSEAENQTVMAYWCCLQLESDIIFELPLPTTGIMALEKRMPLPNVDLAARDFGGNVMMHFLTQIHFRRHLREIRDWLYQPTATGEAQPANMTLEDVMRAVLRELPPQLCWDQPAADILDMRLRAQWSAALIHIYRPFVRHILDFNFNLAHGTRHPVDAAFDGCRIAGLPSIPEGATSADEIPASVLRYAFLAIQGLIQSTSSFQREDSKRCALTNIFGAAYAQWNNLLVLAAAFEDPVLGVFIDGVLLRDLFTQTIRIVSSIAEEGSSLEKGTLILTGLRERLWPGQTQQA